MFSSAHLHTSAAKTTKYTHLYIDSPFFHFFLQSHGSPIFTGTDCWSEQTEAAKKPNSPQHVKFVILATL